MANPNKKLAGEKGLYLYGVSRAAAKKGKAAIMKPGSPGIDGVSAVKAIACGDFICWVSGVDNASFAQDMERNIAHVQKSEELREAARGLADRAVELSRMTLEYCPATSQMPRCGRKA